MTTITEPNGLSKDGLSPGMPVTVIDAPSVDLAEGADLTPTPFAGITPEELETLHSLMSDKDIARIGANLGRKDVLWSCDDFAEKLGFSKKVHAYRVAKQKNLIKYSLPLKDVIGVEEIDGMPVINPIPIDTVYHPMGHPVVKFMETWPLLQWMTLAPTELGARVTNVLWRIFFARDDGDNMLRRQLDEAKKQLEDAKQEVREGVCLLMQTRDGPIQPIAMLIQFMIRLVIGS